KLKKFSVSTAPEVGRIIDTWNLPSTVISSFSIFLAETVQARLIYRLRRVKCALYCSKTTSPAFAMDETL
ncbi:hypothetical protein, partial [Pseudomonas alvandae]|uniref:hypothetical protein n=2 Tax=Pseudomonas canavaninivorans TaxID=2842348 RepID=UPI002B1D7D24